jgi:hypothetical protein
MRSVAKVLVKGLQGGVELDARFDDLAAIMS